MKEEPRGSNFLLKEIRQQILEVEKKRLVGRSNVLHVVVATPLPYIWQCFGETECDTESGGFYRF